MAIERIGRIAAATPNWRSPVTLSYEFDTVVLTSRDGTEQRESRRQSARVELEYRSWFRPDTATRMMADLNADQNEPFFLPIGWRSINLRLGCSIGQQLVYVDGTPPHWLVPGAPVILFNGVVYEVAYVDSVVADGLFLQNPVASEQVIGGSVTFAYHARAQDTVDFVTETTDLWEATLQFDVVPGSDAQTYPARDDLAFEGRPVFLEKPNWSGAPRIKLTEEREVVDAGYGVIAVGSPVPYSTLQNRFGFNPRTRQHSELFLSHFLWCKGRRNSFFMPTWQRDLRLVAGALATESTLTVDGADFYQFAGSPVFNTVMATLADGTYQVNRIDSMAVAGGNTEVTFVDPWDDDVLSTARVCWCPRVRFSTDRLEVNWLTTEVTEIEVTVQTIVNPAPEVE